MTAGDGRRLGRLVLWRDGGGRTRAGGRVRARRDVAVLGGAVSRKLTGLGSGGRLQLLQVSGNGGSVA